MPEPATRTADNYVEVGGNSFDLDHLIYAWKLATTQELSVCDVTDRVAAQPWCKRPEYATLLWTAANRWDGTVKTRGSDRVLQVAVPAPSTPAAGVRRAVAVQRRPGC